jgi:hypothetical protein
MIAAIPKLVARNRNCLKFQTLPPPQTDQSRTTGNGRPFDLIKNIPQVFHTITFAL